MQQLLDKKLLKECVHCGLCLDYCPTYRVLGHEADSPRGRIYQVRQVYEGKISADDLEDHLETYFNGLMQNVGVARKLETAAVPASVALHPMTSVPGWSQAYGAEIRTWNAFSKGEPLLLLGEITRRDCAPGRMQIFFALSQAPRDHATWNMLRALRDATTC